MGDRAAVHAQLPGLQLATAIPVGAARIVAGDWQASNPSQFGWFNTAALR